MISGKQNRPKPALQNPARLFPQKTKHLGTSRVFYPTYLLVPLAGGITSFFFKISFLYDFKALLKFVAWIEVLSPFLMFVLFTDNVQQTNQLKRYETTLATLQ